MSLYQLTMPELNRLVMGYRTLHDHSAEGAPESERLQAKWQPRESDWQVMRNFRKEHDL